jgi:hypothetical protein
MPKDEKDNTMTVILAFYNRIHLIFVHDEKTSLEGKFN